MLSHPQKRRQTATPRIDHLQSARGGKGLDVQDTTDLTDLHTALRDVIAAGRRLAASPAPASSGQRIDPCRLAELLAASEPISRAQAAARLVATVNGYGVREHGGDGPTAGRRLDASAIETTGLAGGAPVRQRV